MNKITQKLFRYFTLMALFLVTIVFVGFYSVFRYYNYHYQEENLKERARTIKTQLETFMNETGPHRGQGAYLKFLDDISMADTYIIDNNEIFLCGDNTVLEKEPSEKILTVADKVFTLETEQQLKKWDLQGNRTIYLGFPIEKIIKLSRHW